MTKKKWSKFLVAILVLTMSVWALAGCGGSSSGGDGEAEDNAKQEQTAEKDLYTATEVTSDLSMADAVKAYYMLVTVNPKAGEYYNIGGTHTCEVGDTLNTLISYSSMKDIATDGPDNLPEGFWSSYPKK